MAAGVAACCMMAFVAVMSPACWLAWGWLCCDAWCMCLVVWYFMQQAPCLESAWAGVLVNFSRPYLLTLLDTILVQGPNQLLRYKLIAI